MNLLSSLLSSAHERRMYRSLLRLDDHLLRDIGFNRVALREELAQHKHPAPDTRL